MSPSSYTEVASVSPNVTKKNVYDFFAFCGAIKHIDIVTEGHAEIVDAAKKEEHHEDVKEKLKRKEFEIFVGGLDKDATEDDLRKVFSEVGNVTDVRLMMNPQTKKNKGFAFLRFATVEQAKRAFTELKNPLVLP
ncbi:nucleolin-like [Forsythia ovata]|uniref:Nucleolin-like n=1 Tax=Forsythia ovata TaxID=205694 RepID=A0ABD1WK99_9LAMI